MHKVTVLLGFQMTPSIQLVLDFLKDNAIVPNAFFHEFVTLLNAIITNAHHHEMDVYLLCEQNPFMFIPGNESLIIKLLRETNQGYLRSQFELDRYVATEKIQTAISFLQAAYTDMLKSVVVNNTPFFEQIIKQHVAINLLTVKGQSLCVEMVYYGQYSYRHSTGAPRMDC